MFTVQKKERLWRNQNLPKCNIWTGEWAPDEWFDNQWNSLFSDMVSWFFDVHW